MMRLMQNATFVLGSFLLGTVRLLGQDASGHSFEVATIRPSDPEARFKSMKPAGRSFAAKNFSVDELIVYSYGIQVKQLIGGDGWLETAKFDITAVPDMEGEPGSEQWKEMVRHLLTSRFGLAVHHEKRELGVYRLSTAKGGPKLKPSDSGNHEEGNVHMNIARDGIALAGRNETMPEFAKTLQQVVVDRPVIEETGIAGRFDFGLTFAPDGAQFGGMRLPVSTDGSTAPSLFTAIQDQMGLKLEAVKAPVDTIVIDHAERPSAN